MAEGRVEAFWTDEFGDIDGECSEVTPALRRVVAKLLTYGASVEQGFAIEQGGSAIESAETYADDFVQGCNLTDDERALLTALTGGAT